MPKQVLISLAITLALGSNLALGQDLAAARPMPDQQAPRLEQGSKGAQILPTGQRVDPWAIPGGQFWDAIRLKDGPAPIDARGLLRALSSPDGQTLFLLTSGFKLNADAAGKLSPADSRQSILVVNIHSPAHPRIEQVIPITNSFVGMALASDGSTLYVGGGVDDKVQVFRKSSANGSWAAAGAPIPLGHQSGLGIDVKPLTAGIQLSRNGQGLLVTNLYNDSLSYVDLAQRRVAWELDLRPGPSEGKTGQPGGESPFDVTQDEDGRIYVSSLRDREIVVVEIQDQHPRVRTRIPTPGNPNRLLYDPKRHSLYVAMDNRDGVGIIDTRTLQYRKTLPVLAKQTDPHVNWGWSTNALAMDPSGQFLFATLGAMNAVAVWDLREQHPTSRGLLPTAWSPQDLVVGNQGTLWVVNNKSNTPGHTGYCSGYIHGCIADSPVTPRPNQYILQLSLSGLQEIPLQALQDLGSTTQAVLANNQMDPIRPEDRQIMDFLRQRIRHVIYIVKENRSYDQVLGDLPQGNGDPSLTEFPRSTTPNQHRLAEQFVLLDHFLDTGEVSGDGWAWSTAARELDITSKILPNNYGRGGGSYDWEGTSRNVNVGLQGAARRQANPNTPEDPNLLPGTANWAAPDSSEGRYQQGYLWSAALRAGKSLRNYGFFVDLQRYDAKENPIPLARFPHREKVRQAYAANPELAPYTDPYFRGFDNAYPDYYRYLEWEREFRGYVQQKRLPELTLLRFMHDHTGSFKEAMDGINTPELQVADNDYAVGLVAEQLAHSPFAHDTLIFVVEDDAQDGPDHLNAHRSTAYIIGPYVKQHAVVSTPYNTLNLLRTMEMILGLPPLSGLDAAQRPMSEVFDPSQQHWDFRACPSALLLPSALSQHFSPAQRSCGKIATVAQPRHDAQYWAEKTKGMDFHVEDHIDTQKYNRILWEGIMGTPYPEHLHLESAGAIDTPDHD